MSDIRQEFKVRRQSDGKYSTGGSYPRWTNRGKTWNQRGHLTNHLGLATRSSDGTYGGVPLAEVEIVVLEMRPHEAEVTPLADAVAGIAQQRAERARTRERRNARARLIALENEAERLRERLGRTEQQLTEAEPPEPRWPLAVPPQPETGPEDEEEADDDTEVLEEED